MVTVNPKTLLNEINVVGKAGRTAMVTSSPGVGKSSIMHEFARQNKLKIIDIRLSQATPEDLNGFPKFGENKATFVPFDIFPLEGDPIPEGYNGWLIFFDEINSASKSVQAAAYKVILDHQVGSFDLHDNVIIMAAGNNATDGAIVNQMSTALGSRMIHYELEVNANMWLDWAFKAGIDHRITSYIAYMPTHLMVFNPSTQEKTFPCPRTWEFLSDVIEDCDVSTDILPRIAGTVGDGEAPMFITFAQEFDRIPKVGDIVADPLGTEIPGEASTKYATMSTLIENFEEDTLSKILEYVDRFPIELKILFCRGIDAKNPDLRMEHKEFSTFLKGMVRYLS